MAHTPARYLARRSPALLDVRDELVRVARLEGARVVELLYVFRRELHVGGLQVVVELFERARAEDDRGDGRLREEPRESNRGGRRGVLACDRPQRLERPPAAVGVEVGEALFPL